VFQPPVHASDDGMFAGLVAQALDELPHDVLDALDNTAVLVADGGCALGVYGLYAGGGAGSPGAPARIVLYRDTLVCDFGHDRRLLGEQVRRTVRHEVAHHLGADELRVATLGL
jgi:predicted Zn-dependent protease with MMP-like domain